MSHDSVLGLLGLARKAGKLEAGEEPVGSACRRGRCRLILLASDAAPNTLRRAAQFSRVGDAPLLVLHSGKEELGRLLGRRNCAILCLTDPGFAAAAAEKLTASAPERRQPADRASRIRQRQRETQRTDPRRRKRTRSVSAE